MVDHAAMYVFLFLIFLSSLWGAPFVVVVDVVVVVAVGVGVWGVASSLHNIGYILT